MKINHSSQPLFLVGCSRSGTTLLQSLLAAHPDIASFRESKFFHCGIPEYEPRRLALGLISRRLKPRMKIYFRDELERPELLQRLPKLILLGYYTRRFMAIMSSLTQEQGKHIFLEKTPDHIYKIDYIEKLIPEARFIHLIRKGVDVVASLYEVTNTYPKPWGGARTIDRCMEDWKRAIEATRRHIHKQNHHLVEYKMLVNNPRPVLEDLCQFIGIEFSEKMLQDYQLTGKQLSLEHEGRAVNQQGIKNGKSQKFYQIFDQEQQHYVLDQLATVNLEELIQTSNSKNSVHQNITKTKDK